MATTAKTKKTATTKPVTRAEAARKLAQDKADYYAKMSPAKRRAMVAECNKYLSQSAPTMEAASSDLLGVLMAVSLEFIKRYYPEATQASLHISNYARHSHDWSAMIPIPVPEAEPSDEK